MSTIFFFGNGFDISMGMETKYEDFIKSRYYSEFRNDSVELGAFIDAQRKFFGWVDLEQSLADFSMHRPQFDVSKEFDLLTAKLLEFLSGVEVKYNENSIAVDILKTKFTPGDQIHVFNYTNTVHLAFSKNSPHKPDGYVHYVHGSIGEKNIILGIDQAQRYSNRHSFMLKSAHDNFKIKSIHSDLMESRAVYWFGHSLGPSDSIYFKEFLSGLADGRLRGDRRLIFYYHGLSEKRNIIARITDMCGGRLAELRKFNELIFINSEV